GLREMGTAADAAHRVPLLPSIATTERSHHDASASRIQRSPPARSRARARTGDPPRALRTTRRPGAAPVDRRLAHAPLPRRASAPRTRGARAKPFVNAVGAPRF